MSITRRRRGLVWQDTVIHLLLTLLGILFAAMTEEGMIGAVILTSFLVLVLRYHRPRPESHDDDAAAHLAELEERMELLESERARILELEERLDFAERLLAHQRDADRLPPG